MYIREGVNAVIPWRMLALPWFENLISLCTNAAFGIFRSTTDIRGVVDGRYFEKLGKNEDNGEVVRT